MKSNRLLTLPLLAFLTAANVALAEEVKDREIGEVAIEEFGKLPVRFNGRITTYRVYAMNRLRQISGREDVLNPKGESISGTRWLLDGIVGKESWLNYRLFQIESPDLRTWLGLESKGDGPDQFVYAATDLPLAKIDEEGRRLFALNGSRSLKPEEQERQQIGTQVYFLSHLRDSLVSPLQEGRAAPQIVDFIERIERAFSLRAVPAAGGTPWVSLPKGHLIKNLQPDALHPAAAPLFEALEAYSAGEEERFQKAIGTYRKSLADHGFGKSPFQFQVPEGWIEIGSPSEKEAKFYSDALQMGRHVASFESWKGDDYAGIDINVFDDPTSETSRFFDEWRVTEGLVPTPWDQARESVEAISVEKFNGHRMDITSPKDATLEANRSVGAVLRRGGLTVVLSLHGKRLLVDGEVENFDKFVRSLRVGPEDRLMQWIGEIDPVPPPGFSMQHFLATLFDEKKGEVWCFEFASIPEKVKENRGALIAFVNSMRISEGAELGMRLQFEKPPSWEQLPGEGSVYAKFVPGGKEARFPERATIFRLRGSWDQKSELAYLNLRLSGRGTNALDEVDYLKARREIEVDGRRVAVIEVEELREGAGAEGGR